MMKRRELTPTQIQVNDEIRNQNLQLRRKLKLNDKYHLDHLIYKNVMDYIAKNQFQNIGIYWPTENEVDTIAIIDELLQHNITVGLPCVLDNKHMIFRTIDTINFDFEYFKSIKQPIPAYPRMNEQSIDLLIMPLLAYNDDLWRLGYGFGFYDRFLNKYDSHKRIMKLGLAYGFQKTQMIYHHENDQQLNILINENGEERR